MFKLATLALLGLAAATGVETTPIVEATSLGAGAAAAADQAQYEKDLKKYTADKAVVDSYEAKQAEVNTLTAAAAAEAKKYAKGGALSKAVSDAQKAYNAKAKTEKLAEKKTAADAQDAKQAAKDAYTAAEGACKAEKDALTAANAAVTAAKKKVKGDKAKIDALKKEIKTLKAKVPKTPIKPDTPQTTATLRKLILAGDRMYNEVKSVWNAKATGFDKPLASVAAEAAFWAKLKTVQAAATKLKDNKNLTAGVATMTKACADLKKALTAQKALAAKNKQADGKAAFLKAKKQYKVDAIKGSIQVTNGLEATAKKANKPKYAAFVKFEKQALSTETKANETAGGSGLTWLWVVLGLAIAGAGGYFLYTKLKKE